MANQTEDIKQKISKWREMNTSYLNEIKSLVKQMKSTESLQIISYFTYSLRISHEPETDTICLGTYHIYNLGDQPLTNPYICIKLSPDSPFYFSGKYVYSDSHHRMRVPDAWERLNDHYDEEEFWLRPIDKQQVQPGEIISFPDFQVKWQPENFYAGSIMGFIYGNEMEEGMAAINQINISGKLDHWGEAHD